MKKAAIIMFAMIFSMMVLLSVPALSTSAEGEACFEITKAYGNPDDTVAVELKINNNPGITALSVSVGYSSEYLELISIEDGGLFENPISLGKLNVNPVAISWYASDSGDKTDNGTVAILKFKILKGAENSAVTVSYNPENVFDSGLQNKYFVTVNGMVGIGEEPTELPTVPPTEPPTVPPTEHSTEPDPTTLPTTPLTEPPTEPPTVVTILLGDVDGDNVVSILDATYIQRKLAGLPNQNGFIDAASDTDGDGSLSILDATFIQRWLAGLSSNENIGKTIR